jgi:hypothetical protein
MWTFALDGFLFAWKLDEHLYYTILWVSGAAYFLMRIVQERLRQRDSQRPVPDQHSSRSL